MIVAAVLTALATMRYAIADDPAKLSQTPPALAWITLHDSRGISMWNYELSLDRGGLTAPDKFYWATVTDLSWGIYRGCCALALWFVDWVMSFSWVKLIASPLLAIESAFQQVVNQLGLVPTFLTITALFAGLLMLRGRPGSAVWEVMMACLIAALAGGAFAHPVQMVAGDDGVVVRAGQLGQEIAAGIATGGATDDKTPEQIRAAQTGQLVDTFIRQPTEMINFGQVIDGTKCEDTYTAVVKDGPYGLDDDIRDKVGSCSDTLGDYAANPSASMAIGSLMILPAAGAVFLMAVMLAGSVVAAAVWAMFQSVKAIVTLITGLLPGGGRRSLMSTIAEVLVSLVMIAGTSIFLSIFLLVVQALFAGAGKDQVAKTFVIVDVLLLVGTIVFLRWRRQLLTAGQRLAQLMSQRPGGGRAPAPARTGPGLGAVAAGVTAGAVRTGIGLAQLRAQRGMANRPPAAPSFVDSRQQALIVVGGGAPQQTGPTWVQTPTGQPAPTASEGAAGDAAASERPLPAGSGRQQLPAGASSQDPAALPPGNDNNVLKRIESRKKKVAGVLASAGTQVALASASGGTSAVIAKSAKVISAARSARRAAVTARMASAAVTAPRTPAAPAIPMGTGQAIPMGRASTPPPPNPAPVAPMIIPGEVIAAPPAAHPHRSTRNVPPAATRPPAGAHPPANRAQPPAPRQADDLTTRRSA